MKPLSAPPLMVLVTLCFQAPAAEGTRADDEVPQLEAVDTGNASASPDRPAVQSIVQPVLHYFVEAPYPEQALAQKLEGRVVLALTVAADGSVIDAEVAESSGYAFFDEAAQHAALQFLFVPAKNNGKPAAVRILYAYDFELSSELDAADAAVEAAVSDQAKPSASSAAHADSRAESGPREGASPAVGGESEELLEVVVQGKSEAARLRESSRAVQIIETEEAQRQTADLGEVLARNSGMGVRRSGGLGSGTRFSLNGLTDEQIRFFLDGVPLEFSGYPFGIANVPVNLVQRVDVYRGVVPIAFGADALGGAVNLVTDVDPDGTHGSASYQAGSFGVHRLALGVQTVDEPTGIFTRANAFVDYADNDYPIDVEVADDRGRLTPAQVYRFHDAYRATGANVETGFVERPWARRLLVRAYITDYEKELQNNVVMTVPYGEVEFGELAAGTTLRYENVFARRLTVEAVGGHAYTVTRFRDVGDCVYNWFGQCVRDRRQPGEIEARPRDQLLWEHNIFGRFNFGRQLHPQHAVRLSLAPTYTTRTGDERRQSDPEARDPLSARRELMTLVSGFEYEVDLFDARLENIAFVKNYLQLARSEEPVAGGAFRDRDRDTHHFGAGNALRYRFVDWLYTKASYEWATRLPRPDEIFGDGLLVIDNLGLTPEVSHNLNVGLTVDAQRTASGEWRADINGFVREADQLIVVLGNDRVFSYQNVFAARSVGAEGALGWTSPGQHIELDGNLTYLDFRNTSSEGAFGDFAGDRIPNRPYLFANASVRFQLREVAAINDELALTWNTRYVHEFFRGWESVGLREFKQVVPSQLLHSLALTYLAEGDPIALSFAGEAQNITDQPSFDFFGVQRPGRAFYFKTTAEF